MSTRRKWKKKLIALAALGAIIAALLLARCAGGFGFGGDGESADKAIRPVSTTLAEERAPPCEIRIDATDVRVAGVACPIEEVPTRCKSSSARLTVTGDARHGDAEAVRARLRGADIEILDREIPR